MLRPERIRGGLKWSWAIANADADLLTLEKTADSGRNLAKIPRLERIYGAKVMKARESLGLSPKPDANGPPGLRASAAEISAAVEAAAEAERAAKIAAEQAAQASLAAEDPEERRGNEGEVEEFEESPEESKQVEEPKEEANQNSIRHKIEQEEERQKKKKGFKFW
ncbi:hypothetical protein IE81DRAFT_93202 [Ceraceosorus guamensis]|uniref:Uncharacterized protein n=1 Tax=Ceraceosorus guamensis TaxID=1522189 RepID=A0A316W0E5_9BASI|nr:hypothetical protein IE81DRAFT_93202 [Ceraceosorus guamensis]PWN43250.1 hypothetical protein IE81DRAFT_93202 [Ceraceosorus guamensis]